MPSFTFETKVVKQVSLESVQRSNPTATTNNLNKIKSSNNRVVRATNSKFKGHKNIPSHKASSRNRYNDLTTLQKESTSQSRGRSEKYSKIQPLN